MPSASTRSVAVLGAGGFIGRALLRELESIGVRATAVVRRVTELSVDGIFHDALVAGDTPTTRFDVVVNLAYPTDGPAFDYPQQDASIRRTVEALVKDEGRVIQVSTLAVFGFGLEHKPLLGPAPKSRNYAYIESKAAMERHFSRLHERRPLAVDIVRLGNVWGRGSGTWTEPLLHRLLTGRPVGVNGAPAYSNATDVENVSSYLAFLISGDAPEDVRYHHLAEFSDVRWPEWLGALSADTGWDPVYVGKALHDAPAPAFGEVEAALSSLKPRSLYTSLRQNRWTGSWTRSIIRALPQGPRARLRGQGLVFAAEPKIPRDELIFLSALAAQQEFRSATQPGWYPPVDMDASLAAVLDWLRRE